MADPTAPASFLSPIIDAIDRVGVTLVVAIGLAWVVKWLFKAHLDALNGRIAVLERVCAERDKQIEAANAKLLETTHDYGVKAEKLSDIVATELRESRKERQQHRIVMARLIDAVTVRPCMGDREFDPHSHRGPAVHPITPRPPSSAELQPAPSDAPTDRLMSHG